MSFRVVSAPAEGRFTVYKPMSLVAREPLSMVETSIQWERCILESGIEEKGF